MSGGSSFLIGLLSIFVGVGTSNHKTKKQKELLQAYEDTHRYEEPSKEAEEIYQKWRYQCTNTRGEFRYKITDKNGELLRGPFSKCEWWRHIFEDEGVEVNERYLHYISGLSDYYYMRQANLYRKYR